MRISWREREEKKIMIVVGMECRDAGYHVLRHGVNECSYASFGQSC